WKDFVDFWSYSVFIDCFDAGVDFSSMQAIASSHGVSREEVQTLTTPLALSYLQEYEKRVCEAALSDGDSVSEFLHEYYWYPTDYVRFGALSENQAALLVSSKKPVAERTLRLFEEQSESLRLAQDRILSQKGFSENPLWFFQNLVAWRDARKRWNFTAMYGFDRICREFLSDRNVDPELFGSVFPPELLDDRMDEKTLLRRKSNGVLLWADVDSVKFIEGARGASVLSSLQAGSPSSALQLRGNPACLGRVIGRVRVVKTPDEPFEAGEILVTVMTRPEFVPLMEKAAGIITDEGGITSHAAVVSRELNRPCIVGTKTATRDLKTGDLVELDAFHGLVKKTNPSFARQ
ncbi:MAG TPA: PEP-utilizing enzyme, partial [Candidatus Norongarragalinales archaeon]|nr:PEP-utilizing enzyme [Candidatus Norongarragalinales archaeon]